MSLAPCWECGKEVSTSAGSCPHCGALQHGDARAKTFKPKRSVGRALILGLGALALVGVVASMILAALSPAPSKPKGVTSPPPSATAASAPAPAPKNLARGLFREPSSGRPLGLWTFDRDTRTFTMLDGDLKVVDSPKKLNTEGRARITSRSGAIFFVKVDTDSKSGRVSVLLYDYGGRDVSFSREGEK